jgi:type VI secretion system protein ImpC
MTSSSSGRRGLSFSIGGFNPSAPRPENRPFYLLVAADTSGRAASDVLEPLSGRSVRKVDVDQLDAVMRSWNARVPVQIGAQATWLEPRSLDELHPDHLLEDVPELSTLLDLRRALGKEPGAAARLELLLGAASSGEPAASATPAASASSAVPSVAAPDESTENTLARLLGGARTGPTAGAASSPPAPTSAARPGVDIERFVRAIVARAAPAPVDPSAAEVALASLADAELGRRLRALLGAPAWRALEATWRSIDGLCRNCPDEELVRTGVLDVSFQELAADPAGLARLLTSEAPDVLLIDHRFAADAGELGALARLLQVCQSGGVQLVAGAHPELAGCAHFAEVQSPEENEHVLAEDTRAAWAAIGTLRENGARLGLALPRFVLRQPYGAAGEPLDQFRFEELPDASDHEAVRWGNGAYLLARALCIRHAQAPGTRPDGGVDIRELPIVHLESDGGSRIKPPAESWLSERAVGRLRAAGFVVLESVRGTDRVIIHPAA